MVRSRGRTSQQSHRVGKAWERGVTEDAHSKLPPGLGPEGQIVGGGSGDL